MSLFGCNIKYNCTVAAVIASVIRAIRIGLLLFSLSLPLQAPLALPDPSAIAEINYFTNGKRHPIGCRFPYFMP